jgi:hypothetical protein
MIRTSFKPALYHREQKNGTQNQCGLQNEWKVNGGADGTIVATFSSATNAPGWNRWWLIWHDAGAYL